MQYDCCMEELEQVVKELVRQLQLFERDQINVYGLTTAQYYTLLEIGKNPGITMNELSRRLNIAISTATRVVDKLVRQDYLLRQRDQADRRVVVLNLTEQGQLRLAEVQKSVSRYYREIITNVPDNELEVTLSATKALMEAFAKANPHCC